MADLIDRAAVLKLFEGPDNCPIQFDYGEARERIAALTLPDDEAGKVLEGVTPGPWRVDGEPWNQIVWSNADNRVCFMAHSNGLNDASDIATARFIAWARTGVPALIAQSAADAARIRELEGALTAEKEENRWAYIQAALDDNKTDAEADAARIRELEAKVAEVTSDRQYIIGFNAGWEEAQLAAEARIATLTAQVEAMRGALDSAERLVRNNKVMAGLHILQDARAAITEEPK